ncbi:hypothetical protein Tco_0726980 [Tanacetum coccineum]|uniref:Uncharacterized protein n=1 Tax=Tanacetum coccineum TaxID=301880 RepID=A0ABQ4YH36_9ASTR
MQQLNFVFLSLIQSSKTGFYEKSRALFIYCEYQTYAKNPSPVQYVVDSCRTGKIVEDDRVSTMRKKVWNESIPYLALLTLETEDGATKTKEFWRIDNRSAQRSRVRKLQYISELERNVNSLQKVSNRWVTLVDLRLGTEFVASEMFRIIEAAVAGILRAFESLEAEDLSNGVKVRQSQKYNSAQQSTVIRLFRRMALGSQNYSADCFTQSSATPYSNEW